MSRKSNDQGRAFEYICLQMLYEEIANIRPVTIISNSSLEAAENAWNLTDESMQYLLTLGAKAMVPAIFELEPLIVEDGEDQLELMIQPDSQGKIADVRDILIIRRNIKWEIGLSVKHNHLAVKHSRLSPNIDFGKDWYGLPCSQEYRAAIKPIFEYTNREKDKNKKWNELSDKENSVYVPILNAFIEEIKRANQKDKVLPSKLVEYLLGKFDFYKVIGKDNQRLTQIQVYNLRGNLSKPSKKHTSDIKVPVSALPTRIISIAFVPGHKNTVELCLNNGWQFTFRIHNASTYVENSLKFDVQIVGTPATLISINCLWKEKD